jgi:bifunctional DNA-binding transcriptional regulator/antitoxin component of YhaV-PrlF toxin-antitoxin module
MATKITKCTTKGQITLPKEWRDQFKTEDFMIECGQKQLVTPINLSELQEEVVFDAERDNGGKGVSVDEMIKTLNKIKNE